MHYWSLLLISFLLVSCDQKDHSGSYLFRRSEEASLLPPPPEPQGRAPYPWEEGSVGGFPRITKDFFRCKGNRLNPPNNSFRDCQGDAHGLPLKGGKEHIFPCLLEILNYIQEKTQKRVIITSGHRCPQHNTYCDPTSTSSKHLIGAEVDFYVEGMEKEPEEVLKLIWQYYKGQKEYESFQRYERVGLNVSTPPWFNKEIFIKLYKENEGRNVDNQHSYPYLGLQVRYDRESKKSVVFDPKQAQNYLRH
jgi:hypothetical protein